MPVTPLTQTRTLALDADRLGAIGGGVVAMIVGLIQMFYWGADPMTTITRSAWAFVGTYAAVFYLVRTILRTTLERGTGPLHAVLRVDGQYRYGRHDNQTSPFVTRIHAYAGQTYVRVLHTWLYTGTPHHHRPQEGDYPHVATQGERLIQTDPTDTGWVKPNDQLQALGQSLTLRLNRAKLSAVSRAQLNATPGAPGWIHVTDGTRTIHAASPAGESSSA